MFGMDRIGLNPVEDTHLCKMDLSTQMQSAFDSRQGLTAAPYADQEIEPVEQTSDWEETIQFGKP